MAGYANGTSTIVSPDMQLINSPDIHSPSCEL
jgi:hypothetical protein